MMAISTQSMKYILYLLLVLPFIGCGSSYLEGHKVRIEFRDATTRDCELLSVRRDVFVVGEDISDSNLRASLISIIDVKRVYAGSSAEVTGMFIGAGVGAIVGGILFATTVDQAQDPNLAMSTTLVGAGMIWYGILGGGLLGYLIPSAEVAYDPMNPKDLISIKELARYDRYSEPPELQKLK
jgi:hypothetical protein